MSFAFTNSRSRKIEPKHKKWVPAPYMERAVDFLLDRGAAALVLDPGLRKTSITLEAFRILQKEGVAKKMLVIAPLRVCQLVWRQEAAKWTQFKDFKITLLHGTNKVAGLSADSDIYLINPEGIAWLCDQCWGSEFPFDTVVIDELTKFKNSGSVRHRKLMPRLAKVPRRWGLTGSFIPNGYLDLFGQMKILDGGLALGFYFTHFRNKYFEKGYSGFDYALRRGSAKAIEKVIKPYVLRMSANDYLDMPPLIMDIRKVVMPAAARKKYDDMKDKMIVELGDDLVEAGNAAAVYSKLKQMANGAVYAGDGVFEPRRVIHIHDAKIEALQELVEELAGEPLFIGYEFNHDLARIQKAFGGNLPYIGSGVTGAQVERIERDWNANRIPILPAHPASAGHGLNFQLGNACHVGWFSCTWDYELYDQFIRRIFRSGNEALRIFNHIFIVENTIDNETQGVIKRKGINQEGLYKALNAEIYHGAPPTGAHKREEPNVMGKPRKLSRKSKSRDDDDIKDVDDQTENDNDDDDDDDDAPRKSRRSKRGTGTRRKLRGNRDPEPDDDDDDDDTDADDDDADDDDAPSRSSRRSRRKARDKAEEDTGEDEDEDEPINKKARRKFSKAVRSKRADIEDDDEAVDEGEEDTGDGEVEEIDYNRLAKAIVDLLADRLAG